MRRLVWISLILVAVMSITVGQVRMNYGYAGPFPPDSTYYKLIGGIINNGIGVDPAGKVWIQTRLENTTRDSIDTPEGGKRRLFPILVFNPDGTPATFSPIRILTGPTPTGVTVTDTLIRGFATGANINPANGNFVAVWGTLAYKPGPLMWEVDYRTGRGVRRVLLSPTPAGPVLQNNVASVAINRDGEYYMASVLGGTPGMILNPDGTEGTQFARSVPAIGRAIAVSRDGNTIYLPRFTDRKTYVYFSSTGSIGPYTLTDSLFLGASVECIAIHPTTGYIWFSNDRRRIDRRYFPNSFYAYNPATKAIVDSFTVSVWDTSTGGPLPRGIAFSPTGDTVYVGHFDVPAMPAVVRFIKNLGVSVARDPSVIPTGYKLSQNYPNPFNPSTTIRFELPAAGLTTLRVYDVMGREVRVLVNEHLDAGSYSTTFDASGLPSGTYIYVLTSGSYRQANKMILMK